MYNSAKNSTICAISTPVGAGGIAVIRVAGEDALAICDKIFVSQKGKKISEQKPFSVIFGKIVNPQSDAEVIDEVLITVFLAPHSFTGENTVEISCHGSAYIQQKILQALLANGAKLAQAGEFTQRAFLNGKMDLAQAEAVADLIASDSAAAHALAMNQMRGGVSNELNKLRSQLLDFVSLMELELDFSEEDVEFANRNDLIFLSEKISKKLSSLINSFTLGNAIKNGIPTAIVGETNTGKSSLLNFLLNEDRAIVSEIHGTTRDTIEDVINIKGFNFRLIDTAGIRHTENEIEKIGIERTYMQIEKAQIVLCLLDCSRNIDEMKKFATKIFNHSKNKKIIIIFNKTDLVNNDKITIINGSFKDFECQKLFISLKEKIGTETLPDEILNAANLAKLPENNVIIANVRHRDALQKSLDAVLRVNYGLHNGISTDLLTQDIRECLHFMGEITGEITSNEILGNIFKKFCIGK